jgi:hypothetical protein
MNVGIIVGFGVAMGIAFLSERAPSAAEANATPATAPTPLVPEAYTARSASVASATQVGLSPPPAGAPAVAARAVPSPVVKFNQYRPHWVVDVH